MTRILLPIVVTVLLLTPTVHADTKPPNIVFILVDNLGKEWLGCYGSQENCTPQMDKLAREGLRVENCYTPVVCGPSRIVALTGRYLLRSGFTYHHDAALYSGGGFPFTEVTFARALKAAGYKTGITGKWQINNLYDQPDALVRHGFDESLVSPMSLDRDKVTQPQYDEFMTHVLADDADFTSKFIANIESRYWDPVFLRDGKREKHPGKFGPDLTQEWSLDFLRRHRDEPFILYYSMFLTHGKTFLEHVVHTPLNAGKDLPEHQMYADMARYADTQIGQVIDELDKLGLRENTVVFVATDNGSAQPITARANGRDVHGGLYLMNEPGSNVPLMVSWPGHTKPGSVLPLADFSDLLPTFCDLAGAKLPAVTLDGKSFAAIVRGQPLPNFRGWIYNGYGGVREVRDERFKLYNDGKFLDITADFDEQHDLRDTTDPAAVAAKQKLQAALDSLPPDAAPPFPLRSQSIFRARTAARQSAK